MDSDATEPLDALRIPEKEIDSRFLRVDAVVGFDT